MLFVVVVVLGGGLGDLGHVEVNHRRNELAGEIASPRAAYVDYRLGCLSTEAEIQPELSKSKTGKVRSKALSTDGIVSSGMVSNDSRHRHAIANTNA